MLGFFPPLWSKIEMMKMQSSPRHFYVLLQLQYFWFFQNNKWQWRSFCIAKEIYELQRIQERTFNVNTAILLCCLWPAIYLFIHFYEIYYSAFFYQVFLFVCGKMNADSSSFKVFFLLSTNSFISFYSKKYCLEGSCVIVLYR